jgi:hypothetical protein
MPEQVIEGSDPALLAESHVLVESEGLREEQVRLSIRNEHVVMGRGLAWELILKLAKATGAEIEHASAAAPAEPVETSPEPAAESAPLEA